MALDIKITRTQNSRIKELDFNNIPFGRVFTDHMFVCDYQGGQWKNPEILPLEKFSVHPSTMAWHYGQAIFEGMKAQISDEGQPLLFRPEDHAQRLNTSARRMCMPEFPTDLFVEALAQLLIIDKDWIPRDMESALYIRPLMIATDEFVGVRASESYRLVIICLPVGPYYSKPISLLVEEHFVRAADGGVGEAKCAGNYGAALYPTKLAREKGYDQVLWMDAKEFKYAQESGTMNVFFVLKDKVLTPNAGGTILKGITRDSLIQLMRDRGIVVEERPVSIDEIVEAHNRGELLEIFGAGTAAVVAQVVRLGYGGKDYMINPESNQLSKSIKAELLQIRKGRLADPHHWIVPVLQEELVS